MGVPRSERVAIFLHSGEYDRLQQGCAIAATAAASGRQVELVFLWFAAEALLQGKLARPHFPGREDLAERFEADNYPTAQALLEAARSTGRCTTYACTASTALMGGAPDHVAELVDHHVGLATILQATSGIVDRFYL